MANLASALKEEIGRLARKEIRQQTAGTAKSAAQCERDIAKLKQQMKDLQSKLSSLGRPDTPKRTAGGKGASRKTSVKKQGKKLASAATKPVKQSVRSRFSAKSLKGDRERLGLSAENYGKLIGVSGLSIYNWEKGQARPRESSIAALMTIRGIGKREAAKRLEALAKPQEKETPAAQQDSAANEDQAGAES